MALVIITLETLEDSRYVFPDMPKDTVDQLVKGIPTLRGHLPSLTLVNASGAAQVIPWRIIKRVLVDDVEVWCCPA